MSQIKDLQVRSKQGAIMFRSNLPWAVISVVTEAGTWPKLADENRQDVIQMNFWDVSASKMSWLSKDLMFDEEKANLILDFVEKVWDKIDVLLVHCEMGISRSPGIAAAIAYCYHGPYTDRQFFKRYTPNTHVYETILKTYLKRHEESPKTSKIL